MARMPDLDEFQGAWTLTRVIKDSLTGAEGHLAGQAVFTQREAGGWDYLETGQLSYADQPPMVATRRYIWQALDGAISVKFEDGRPFHLIDTEKLMPDANHHCDPDLYHVSYDFTGWPAWRAVWRVVGPKKDYRMLSQYTRA